MARVRWAVVVCLLLAVACTGQTDHFPLPNTPTESAPPEMCPKLQASLRHNNVAGMRRVLVPGHPTTLVVCSSGTRAVIEDAKKVTAVRDQLNGLDKRLPPSICGPREVGLSFGYDNGQVLFVGILCDAATNGKRTDMGLDRPALLMIQSLLHRADL